MRSDVILDQIFSSPVEGEVFLRLAGAERLPLAAGQLWLGVSDPLIELLPSALYPAMDEDGQWYLAGSIPSGWQPGVSLNLRGPIGRGFSLPRRIRRVACVSLDERIYYLLPVMRQAFLQAAEVVYCGPPTPLRLPPWVEMFTLEQWQEWWEWAEYIAVQGSLLAVGTFFNRLAEKFLLDSRRVPIEVLIHSQIPCGGMAECGVCAVPTRRKWLLICRNGAVFDAYQLDWSVIEG